MFKKMFNLLLGGLSFIYLGSGCSVLNNNYKDKICIEDPYGITYKNNTNYCSPNIDNEEGFKKQQVDKFLKYLTLKNFKHTKKSCKNNKELCTYFGGSDKKDTLYRFRIGKGINPDEVYAVIINSQGIVKSFISYDSQNWAIPKSSIINPNLEGSINKLNEIGSKLESVIKN